MAIRGFLLILLSQLLACHAFAENKTVESDSARPRMLFLGDIMLSRNVLKERNSRQENPWRNLDTLFRRADWIMGNFEGAVGSPAECLADSLGPCFAVPESLATDLKRAGISALSIANNHAMDLGREGRNRTRRTFSEIGLSPMDFESSPFFKVLGGHTLAVICLSMVPGKDGTFQTLPGIKVARKFRTARAFSDRIVVFVHWGAELQDWPNADQIRAADWMVRQGADLILGAHPHVVQAPACVRGKPVFYSLGNHLFDQKYPQTKQGLIADCVAGSSGFSCRSIWTETPSGGFYPRLATRRDPDTAGLICPDSAAASPSARATPQSGPMSVETRWSGGAPRHRWKTAGIGGRTVSWESPADKFLSASSFRLRDKPEKVFMFRLEQHFSPLDRVSAPRPYVYEVARSGPIARWRGSGLAWPLLDAGMLPGNEDGILCALHRGDSFVAPNPETLSTRLAAYRWNGFGFTLVADILRDHPDYRGTAESGKMEPENPMIEKCREVLEPE